MPLAERWLAMSKDGGAAPNYNGAAGQDYQNGQQSTNQQTQNNRPDQSNAFGASSNWTKDANGNWTQSSTLGGGLGQAAGNLEGQIAGQGAIGNGDQARDAAVRGSFNQSKALLDPQWGQGQEALTSQLAAQGLDPNSQAGQSATQQFGAQRNAAYQGAANAAEMQGTQAQQATFGENYQAAMMPYQQLGALGGLTGQQSFNQAGAYNPSSLLQAAGLQGNYQLGSADMANQWMGAAASGLGAAGGAAAALSDERMKTDVERLPVDAIPGVPLATFAYKHDPGKHHLGVIAQDLEKVRPDLVQTGSDGLKRVPKTPPFSF